MMTFHDFRNEWAQISPHKNGFLNLEIKHSLNFKIGYYFSQFKSFIVMNTGVVREISSTFAVRVVNAELNNGTWILEFQLLHSAFEEEFLRLCWDMIESTVNTVNALDNLISKYISWQKLLQSASKKVLSFQNQKGLLGELLFLQESMTKIGTDKAVFAWIGPEGSDQDFLFEETWAEIKTVALSADSVSISSLEQFEQEQDGLLVVYVLEKSTEGTGRITLTETVENILTQLETNLRLREQFEMKIFKYGYREMDRDEYMKNWFRLVEKREYCVDSTFPKLTRLNVHPEIIGCSYLLSISAIEKYRRM